MVFQSLGSFPIVLASASCKVKIFLYGVLSSQPFGNTYYRISIRWKNNMIATTPLGAIKDPALPMSRNKRKQLFNSVITPTRPIATW